jgi:hypothetical protein
MANQKAAAAGSDTVELQSKLAHVKHKKKSTQCEHGARNMERKVRGAGPIE